MKLMAARGFDSSIGNEEKDTNTQPALCDSIFAVTVLSHLAVTLYFSYYQTIKRQCDSVTDLFRFYFMGGEEKSLGIPPPIDLSSL